MSNPIRTYKELMAWQRAYTLGRKVQIATKSYPADERFHLVSQSRPSATGVSFNIAEGYGRGTRDDYIRFLRHARGSLYELEMQHMFGLDFGYLPQDRFDALISLWRETERLLAGLIRSLEQAEPRKQSSCLDASMP